MKSDSKRQEKAELRITEKTCHGCNGKGWIAVPNDRFLLMTAQICPVCSGKGKVKV